MTVPREKNLSSEVISDEMALNIVQNRCASCHSATPTQEGINSPPKNIILNTVADMKHYSMQINQQAIISNSMPLGNITNMTDDERGQLNNWLKRNK